MWNTLKEIPLPSAVPFPLVYVIATSDHLTELSTMFSQVSIVFNILDKIDKLLNFFC